MAVHRVIVKPSADRELQRLPADIQRRIVVVLRELSIQARPPGVVKMEGAENLWRVRVGVYRIVYEIHEREIVVMALRIGHRKDVYR